MSWTLGPGNGDNPAAGRSAQGPSRQAVCAPAV